MQRMAQAGETRWANSLYWGAAGAHAAKGLVGRQAELPPKTLLYRFIDLNRGWVEKAADGPWWFEQSKVKLKNGLAARTNRPLAHYARRLVSVHEEFEKVDAIVWARVGPKPLLVWRGLSRFVADEEGESLPADSARDAGEPPALDGATAPAADIQQIFVPGLGVPYRRLDAFMRIEGAARLEQEVS